MKPGNGGCMNSDKLIKILTDHKNLTLGIGGDCANLRGANLGGTVYGKEILMNVVPIQIIGFKYSVLILDRHIKIGCNLASINEWIANGDSLIPEEDKELWTAYKPALIAVLKAAGRI